MQSSCRLRAASFRKHAPCVIHEEECAIEVIAVRDVINGARLNEAVVIVNI